MVREMRTFSTAVGLVVIPEGATEAFECGQVFYGEYKTIKNISLYETRRANRFNKAVKQLHEIQAERRFREAEEMEKAAAIFEMEEEAAAAAPGRQFIYSPPDGGFAFSVAEIKLHIRLRDRLFIARRCQATRQKANAA